MNFKQLANLDEMKMMARGNPQKIAAYAAKKHELEGLKAAHFNEEHPFVNGFRESHLEELKQFAADNPDDESAQIRYNLQRERFAVQESQKTAHIDGRVAQMELRHKIREGEPLTKADLQIAEKLARRVSSAENIAMYSQVKALIAAENEEQTEES